MAKILPLGNPPQGSRCGHYRGWLLSAFDRHICAYCLIQHEALDIEHYEPKAYASHLRHEPTNLLLACRYCNSNKLDYHPNHNSRLRYPSTSHLTLDIRVEDFALLMEVDNSGQLAIIPGPSYNRVDWNVNTLLNLNRQFLVDRRRELLKALDNIHTLSDALENEDDPKIRTLAVKSLECFVDGINEHELFFYCFDLPLPDFFKNHVAPLYRKTRSTVLP